jgi:hypothetical protein
MLQEAVSSFNSVLGINWRQLCSCQASIQLTCDLVKANNACDFDFWEAMLYAIDAAIRTAPENEGGSQVKLLTQLNEIGRRCAQDRSSRIEPYWYSLKKGCHLNNSCLCLAVQLQLYYYVRYALAHETIRRGGHENKQRDYATMLLMAIHHYKIFAKDSDIPRVSIIPKETSLELIKFLPKRG